LMEKINEARKNMPSVLYIPGIEQWWGHETASIPLLRASLLSFISNFDSTLPILVLGTVNNSSNLETIPDSFKATFFGTPIINQNLYNKNPITIVLEGPSEQAVVEYLYNTMDEIRDTILKVFSKQQRWIMEHSNLNQTSQLKKRRRDRILEIAPPSPVISLKKAKVNLSEEKVSEQVQKFLQKYLTKLFLNGKYSEFINPVEISVAPDYYHIIKQPMTLIEMEKKLKSGRYRSFEGFMQDLELILRNAQEYNPCDEADEYGRKIVRRAKEMIAYIEERAKIQNQRLGFDLLQRFSRMRKEGRTMGKKSATNGAERAVQDGCSMKNNGAAPEPKISNCGSSIESKLPSESDFSSMNSELSMVSGCKRKVAEIVQDSAAFPSEKLVDGESLENIEDILAIELPRLIYVLRKMVLRRKITAYELIEMRGQMLNLSACIPFNEDLLSSVWKILLNLKKIANADAEVA